jgi:hypothetical protein
VAARQHSALRKEVQAGWDTVGETKFPMQWPVLGVFAVVPIGRRETDDKESLNDGRKVQPSRALKAK